MEVETVQTVYMPRVNGHMLGNYIDKTVLVVAELLSIDNLKMKIKCCDGPIIMVNLQEPVHQQIQPGTIVQIEAIPQSKNVLNCNDFIILPVPNNDFNLEMYSDAVKILAETEGDNSYLINDLTAHWGSDNEKEISLVDGSDLAQNPNANKQNGNTQNASSQDAAFV